MQRGFPHLITFLLVTFYDPKDSLGAYITIVIIIKTITYLSILSSKNTFTRQHYGRLHGEFKYFDFKIFLV